MNALFYLLDNMNLQRYNTCTCVCEECRLYERGGKIVCYMHYKISMLERFYFKNVTAEDSIPKISHDYFEFPSGFQLPKLYHRKSCGEVQYLNTRTTTIRFITREHRFTPLGFTPICL